MRNLLPLSIILTVCLSSCIVTVIHYNGYNQLTDKGRTLFRPFSIEDIPKTVSYDDSCVLQRINHKNISEISKVYPVFWVELFTPWCSGSTCKRLGAYQDKAQKAGAKLILVSIGYQYSEIREKLKGSGINQMVYVLDTCYSKRTNKSDGEFFHAIKRAPWLPQLKYQTSYIIKNDTIVWMHDYRQPDSVFQNALSAFSKGDVVAHQVYPIHEHK